MRLGLVSTYAPRRHDLAGPAAALARELATHHELCVVAVDRHGLEYPDEVSAVISEDRLGDYGRAARILGECGVEAVLIEYDETAYGGPGGSHVLELARQLRDRSIPTLVHLHALPHPVRAGGRVLAGLVELASAVLVPSPHAAGLVVGRVAGAERVVVVPPGAPTPTVAEGGDRPVPNGSDEDGSDGDGPDENGPDENGSSENGRTITVLGPIGPERGLERTLRGVAKIAADHPDVRLVLAETGFDESTQDERRTYLAQLWDLAHELGVAERTTVLNNRLGAGERAEVLQRTTVLLAPWLPAERPAFAVLGEAMAAGCAVVATAHPYSREVLASGAGLILTDDDPEEVSHAVGRLLSDTAWLADTRRRARTEGVRFAWPAVAQRIAAAARSVAADAVPARARPSGGCCGAAS